MIKNITKPLPSPLPTSKPMTKEKTKFERKDTNTKVEQTFALNVTKAVQQWQCTQYQMVKVIARTYIQHHGTSYWEFMDIKIQHNFLFFFIVYVKFTQSLYPIQVFHLETKNMSMTGSIFGINRNWHVAMTIWLLHRSTFLEFLAQDLLVNFI